MSSLTVNEVVKPKPVVDTTEVIGSCIVQKRNVLLSRWKSFEKSSTI